MLHRSPRTRAAALASATMVALALSLTPAGIAAGTDAAQAESGDDSFAPQLVTVDTPTRADKDRLQTLGLDLTEHAGHDYVEVVLHTAADRQALEEAGFGYDVRIRDLLRREALNNEVNAQYAASIDRSQLPSGRTSYRTLEDYEADMAALAEQRPQVARTFELERPSLDGHTVKAIEVAGKVNRKADGRPTFLLMGLHHAREWPSGELAMEFATELTQQYGKNKRITRLLDNGRVVVVPVVNPDGFDLSRTDGGLVDLRELDGGGTVSILGTPGQAYKRKNCRVVDGQDTPDGSCRATLTSPGGFGLGVDLNRNYGGHWGGPGASGPMPDAEEVETGIADPTYRGAAPFSEPETQNIRDLVSSRQVTMLISNHTFSNLILRPNGVHPDTIGPDGHPVGDAPDEGAMRQLGARMAAQNGYANTHSWELYDTTGTTEDWSYNATGGFGYTFEIGPDEFHPPFPQVVDEYLGAGKYAGKGNREAYLIALEAAIDRDTHGVLRGRAPKGATLRLSKTFQTPTWESSFEDSLESVLRVRNPRFTWDVNPSTRPVSKPKVVETTEAQEIRSRTYDGGPIPPNEHVDHDFSFDETGVDELVITLDWPTPDDMDLEVYRRQGGELVQVGTSGAFVGEKEKVEIADPVPGDYVIRVINFASASPSYTVTAGLFEEVVVDTERVPGKVERWTLTCEKKGTVLQSTQVRVERGQVEKVNLAQCRRRW